MKLTVIYIAISFLLSLDSRGAIELSTKNLLIGKFTELYSRLDTSDPSKVTVGLRLADLLSDRGRDKALNELKRDCAVCIAGDSDREQALTIYGKLLPRITSRQQKSGVLEQMGHLCEQLGRPAQAIEYYLQALALYKKEIDRSRLQLAIGEVFFNVGNYSKSISFYDSVLAAGSAKGKSLAAYRRAHALFHKGNTTAAISAIIDMLESPALMARISTRIASSDKQYRIEISKSLATFMSRTNSNAQSAELLYRHSPSEVRMSNVSFLASAMERKGRFNQAADIYRLLVDKSDSNEDRLRFYLDRMRIFSKRKESKKALSDFHQALNIYKDNGRKEDSKNKKTLRRFVLDWHKERTKTSPPLIEAHRTYLQKFPGELDMRFWYAQALKKIGNNLDAFAEYERVIAALDGYEKSQRSKLPLDLETLLLTCIELAETAAKKDKDTVLLSKSYRQYIERSKKKTHLLYAHYKLAYSVYRQGDYESAATALRDVALLSEGEGTGGRNLKKKAADLALDSLVLLKDDVRLEKWSKEFAGVFPRSQSEYLSIERKSLLNQSSKLASEDLNASWETLMRVRLDKDTNKKEKVKYFKNRLILAEKLNKFSEVRKTADSFLRLGGIPRKDLDFALALKAWSSEMLFDFETTYKISKRLRPKELSREDRDLRLALFAELAGKDPLPHYRDFLKRAKGKDKKRAKAVALKIVERSKTPLTDLLRCRRFVEQSSDNGANEFARMYLERILKISKKGFEKHSRLIAQDKKLKNTPAAQFLWRQKFLSRLSKKGDRIAQHRISHSSQKRLARTLGARVKMLEGLGKMLKRAAKRGDWSSQVVALGVLSTETNRLYNELFSLPMPAGLNAQEQTEYMQLLSQQAAPYQKEAKQFSAKLAKFWSEGGAVIENMEDQYIGGSTRLRSRLKTEIELLVRAAPSEIASELKDILNYRKESSELPNAGQIVHLRKELKEDPTNRDKLSRLIKAEKEFGQTAIVSYLQARMEKLEGAK